MPPNPHALAIVEPHYLLSDLVLALWAAEGFWGMQQAAPPGAAPAIARIVILAALALRPLAGGLLREADRRGHLFSYDFARGVFQSAPPGSLVVAKKDVQLYSLWHYQIVSGWRPDLRLVSQGLAGSRWYQDGWRRQNSSLSVRPLRAEQDWRSWRAVNGPFYASMDADITLPPDDFRVRGLLNAILPGPEAVVDVFDPELLARRGRYVYEDQPDFFASDLVEAHVQASFRRGTEQLSTADAAQRALKAAWAAHFSQPEPAVFLGYLAYTGGRLEEARRYYGVALTLYERTLKLAADYRALPDVISMIRRGAAESATHLGATIEKLGDPQAALALYKKSIAFEPTAQAHFNLAVQYWNGDRARAEEELRKALRLDPAHPEARRYLAILTKK